MTAIRKQLAALLRKLTNWLDPDPTATPQGGGGTGPRQ